jgi:tetratricopeptide (TPR) repeat protein
MTDPDLVTLLRSEQREQWRRGERVPVESYLERQPALGDDPEGLLDLIYNEVVLREEAGDRPQLEEYLGRFPRFRDQLRLQFQVHRALEAGVALGPDSRELPSPPADRTSPPLASEPVSVPGYEILGELGRGGMGVVYLARQVALKRRVALKMILAGAHAGPKELARFRTEAEAVARLQHPNIVQIYEVVDEPDGRPCLAMELVDGGSLAEPLAGTPRPPRPAAELVQTLARAVHEVHRHGIVHRDLKPSNVLLTADGVPKITDFGLAKLLDTDSGQTPSEAFLGTPSYMAPEQAAGRTRSIGPLSDIYSLGAILYELLTGRPPFRAETPLDTVMQVIYREPVPPSRLQPKVTRDLETICLKCLEKMPSSRYPDAGELADDLGRFLAGESIRGRPTPAWRRALKWARRRPAAASLLGVGLTAVLLAIALGLLSSERERRRLRDLRAEGQALVDRGQVAFTEGRWEDARLQLSKALARIGHERALADLSAPAGRLLAEAQRTLDVRARRREFDRRGDEVLFRGTQPLDVDAAANLRATEAAARAALAAVGSDADPEAMPALDPRFSGLERAEIVSGCYEILLVLADALAQPIPRRTPEDRRARVARALRILDRAASLGPPTRAYHLRRARYLALLGDPAAAEEQRTRAEALPTAGAIDSFLIGVDSYLGAEGPLTRGDLAGAIRHFDRALRLKPDHFWARYYLAVCHLNADRPDLADVSLTACLGQKPGFLWAYLLRGFARGALGDFEAAEADFREAEQLGPNADARYALLVNRGAARLEQGRFADAVGDLEEAVHLKPDHYRAHVNLALLFKRQRKLVESRAELDRATQLDPPAAVLADLQAERADLLLLGERYREAVAACDVVLETRPAYAAVLAVRARASLELGEDAEAVRSFTRYLDRGGEPKPDIYRGRGQARMRLGDYPGAADDYTRALLIAPDREIRVHRGWAYFFAEAHQLALHDFEDGIRLDPGPSDAYIGRGLARVALGRYREAVADAEDALRRRPDSPEMLHNLACIFAQATGRAESDRGNPDGPALAGRYRDRAIELVRATLDRLAPDDRPAFWRDKILPDRYLDPIRRSAPFLELEARMASPAPRSSP